MIGIITFANVQGGGGNDGYCLKGVVMLLRCGYMNQTKQLQLFFCDKDGICVCVSSSFVLYSFVHAMTGFSILLYHVYILQAMKPLPFPV